MGDESVFIFKLEDGGGSAEPPRANPGAAARGAAGGSATPDRTSARPPARGRSPKQESPERISQPLVDAIEKATRAIGISAFARPVFDLVKPFVDAGRALAGKRSGVQAPVGRAAAVQSPIQLAQAAINVASAGKVAIVAGQVAVLERGGVPTGGRARRGFAPALPAPRAVPRGRLPGLPAPAVVGSAARAAPAAASGAAGGAGIAGLAASAGPVGLAFAGIVVAAGAAVIGLKALHRSASRQAKELSAFSATLATAQARSQVTQVQADIRSAQQLGGDLARLTDAQAALRDEFQQAMDGIKAEFLPLLNKLIELTGSGLSAYNELVEQGQDVRTVLLEIAGGTTAIWNASERFEELTKKRDAEEQSAKALAAGDFGKLFDKLDDLDIGDNEGRLGDPGGARPGIVAPGFGDLPLP